MVYYDYKGTVYTTKKETAPGRDTKLPSFFLPTLTLFLSRRASKCDILILEGKAYLLSLTYLVSCPTDSFLPKLAKLMPIAHWPLYVVVNQENVTLIAIVAIF